MKNFAYNYPILVQIAFASLFFGLCGYGMTGIYGALIGAGFPILLAIIGFAILISMVNKDAL